MRMENARSRPRQCAGCRSATVRGAVRWPLARDAMAAFAIRAHRGRRCPLYLSLRALDLTCAGTIGHVAHGKSTVVKAISGVQTVRFKTELERNITIKLGYANAKIFKCDNPKCPRPGNYKSYGSGQIAKPKCERVGCNSLMTLQRHVSFVDWSTFHLTDANCWLAMCEHSGVVAHVALVSYSASLTAPVTIF